MTKAVNWLPNLRVDVDDVVAGTTTMVQDSSKQIHKSLSLDDISRISSGFRVEIANQTTSPGELTVYNGFALNHDGQDVVNENDINAQRSITLTGTATYFVEIEYTSAESDTDARAFWDPTYDNGVDPSGDARLAGREFSQNVATRLNQDWQIVSPVSTTAFDAVGTAGSVKIPVAIVEVTAGSIVLATTNPARTVLREATVAATTTSLKVVSSLTFPDAFALRLDPGGALQEDVTVTANDRDNNILTLSAAVTNTHLIGTRMVNNDASPPQFLDARTAADPVLPADSSVTEDARPMLFKGNEELGFAYKQNPLAAGQNDTQVDSLKRYVDFLAAELREIKYGSGQGTKVGTTAPPITFASAPRYYDYAGSLQGARLATVSVGDGVESWGDFNVTQVGSAQAAIQNAVDALPADGGILLIKGSSTIYDVTTTTVTIAKNIVLMGEGSGRTKIKSSAGGIRVFTLTGGNDVTIKDISILQDTPTASSGRVLDIGTGGVARLTIQDSVIEGIFGVNAIVTGTFSNTIFASTSGSSGDAWSADITAGSFTDCTFKTVAGAAGNALIDGSTTLVGLVFTGCTFSILGTTPSVLSVDLTDCTFDRCTFTTATAGNVTGSTFNNCTFRDCSFALASGATDTVLSLSTSSKRTTFEKCVFSGGNADTVTLTAASNVSFISLKQCTSSVAGGFIDATGTLTDDWLVDKCDFVFGPSGKVGIDMGTNTHDRVTIRDCYLQQTGAPTITSSTGLLLFGTDSTISGCLIEDADQGIMGTYNTSHIVSNTVTGSTAGRGVVGVSITATGTNVAGNNIVTVESAQSATHTGISVTATGCNILNNLVSTIGNAATTDARGVYVAPTSTDLNINNNTINGITATNSTAGVYLDGGSSTQTIQRITCSNNIIDNLTNLAYGIRGHNVLEASISKNVVKTIGNGTNVPYGIFFDRDENTIDSESMILIDGNTIYDLNSGGTGSAIRCLVGEKLSIIDNKIEMDDTFLTDAIHVNTDTGPSNFDIRNLNVSGNSITAGAVAYSGAITINNRTSSATVGKILVMNNILEGFTATGLQMIGFDIANVSVIVSGNVLASSGTNVSVGISITNFSKLTVSNNNINFPATVNTNAEGIVFVNCDNLVCSGNYVDMPSATTTSACIRAKSTSSSGLIIGNFCIVTAANNSIDVSTQASDFFVVGNMAQGGVTTRSMTFSTTAISTARLVQAENANNPYVGTGEAELNWDD